MGKYAFVERAVWEYPWATTADRLDMLCDVVSHRLDESLEARAGREPASTVVDGIAVIPIQGMLAQRMNFFMALFGGMSTDAIGRAVQAASADPAVTAILLDVDSPGGSVFGLQELGDTLYTARRKKPLIAVANAVAASGAYWLASQAHQLLVTPSGMVGSIGIIAAHIDRSKQAAMHGMQHTILSAGKYKAEGHDMGPLDDPARLSMQAKIDQYYDSFVRAVARGRGVKGRDVREGFGEGRVVTARDAVAEGMVDGVATFEQVLGSLVSGATRVPLPGGRAEMGAELAELRAKLDELTLSA